MKDMFFFQSAEECCGLYFGSRMNNFEQEWCAKVDVCPYEPSDEVLPVSPTREPTNQPTSSPSKETTNDSTSSPTKQTTTAPSKSPTNDPTSSPTKKPSAAPTRVPTSSPTTAAPSKSPTNDPTSSPTKKPSAAPTHDPTSSPTKEPSAQPSAVPSVKPSGSPSLSPSAKPSLRQSSNELEIIIQEVLAAAESERTISGSKSSKANSFEESFSLQEEPPFAPSFAPSYSTPKCTFCPAGIPDGEIKPEGAKGKTCNEIQGIANKLEPMMVPILCEQVIQIEESICCPNQPYSSPSEVRLTSRGQRRTRRSGRRGG
jgi:hypothetical protein